MNFLKSSGLVSLSTIIKMLSGLVVNKIIAIAVGPSGIALIGNFGNFKGIASSLGSGATNQGIIKYVAEYKNETIKFKQILSSGFAISLFCSIFAGLTIFFFRFYLSDLIFRTKEYAFLFILFAITLSMFSFKNLFLSILNGLKEIKKYILLNILLSLTNLTITSILALKWELIGALIAMSINESIVFIIMLFALKKEPWFTYSTLTGFFDKKIVKKLLTFSLMALFSMIALPLTMIYMRTFIGEQLSWYEAGVWESSIRISGMYLALLTGSFSVYLLPSFSETSDPKLLQKELKTSLKYVFLITTSISLGIFLFRRFIVLILFTDEFLLATEIIPYQLIADCIKMFTWVFGYMIMAKADIKAFITVDLIFCFSFILISKFLIELIGLKGVPIANAISYSIILIFMIFYFRKLMFTKFANERT